MSGPSGCTEHVVVAGAGCSGVLVAANLAGQGGRVRVTLLDRGWWPGRGAAYATTNFRHLLNVPAASMSAFDHRPDHFVTWSAVRHPGVTGASYLPRRLFGDYLSAVLADSVASASGHIECRIGRATAVVMRADGITVGLADGGHVAAHRLVVATGNLPPRDPPLADRRFVAAPAYVRDPWAPGALDGVAGTEPVLLVGTGLTAVDVTLSLLDAGHSGPIVAASRHGLLPRAHVPGGAPPRAWAPPLAPVSCRRLLEAFRAELRSVVAEGGDWREVVDGLRPVIPSLWQGLGHSEQARFLRHLCRLWEVHRHRMAPEVAASIESSTADGSLEVRAARLDSAKPVAGGVEVVLTGRQPGRLKVSRVVNCTGPSPDVSTAGDPLLDWLLGSGAARRGPHGLGLDVSAEGALVDAAGAASARLFTLGSLRRGHLWETTAVPEIRRQAEELARSLAADRREVKV